jgi:hypothetical protein
MKNIKIKYIIFFLLLFLVVLFGGWFLIKFLKTIPGSPFTPKPEEIITEFIEVNKTVSNDEKNIPLPESDIRKNLLEPIKEIENIKNDDKRLEKLEKYTRYKALYNELLARYNATRDSETLSLLKEFRTFFQVNYKEQYEGLEKQYPNAWEIIE